MALLITNRCINCDMCEPECPNDAISMGMEIYQIDFNRCTECVGHYVIPTCKRVCPIEGAIIYDSEHVENQDQLFARFTQLHPGRTPRKDR